MNDPEKSSVRLFSSIQEIIAHIEIHSTLHQKWMILSRVLFNIFKRFMEIFYWSGKVRNWVKNEWIEKALSSNFMVLEESYPRSCLLHYIAFERNHSYHS